MSQRSITRLVRPLTLVALLWPATMTETAPAQATPAQAARSREKLVGGSLEGDPAPVTVITAEMIRLSGARTLHDALLLFVPGYTDIEDRNELNFAPRGIYATSQQKVLVLIDGHRLNSRSLLTAMPDYGIALHQLDRIEVLRGPGSSRYGNVALAGVINLVTRRGRDQDGTSVEISAGNQEQRRMRFLSGAGTDDWDVLVWGQSYRTPGELHDLDGNEPFNPGRTGQIRIDGVEHENAHDLGVTFRTGDWTFFGSSRRGQWIEPYDGASVPYVYDAYRTYHGAGPGLGLSQQHVGATYEGSLPGWTFSVNPYYDQTTTPVSPRPIIGVDTLESITGAASRRTARCVSGVSRPARSADGACTGTQGWNQRNFWFSLQTNSISSVSGISFWEKLTVHGRL